MLSTTESYCTINTIVQFVEHYLFITVASTDYLAKLLRAEHFDMRAVIWDSAG